MEKFVFRFVNFLKNESSVYFITNFLTLCPPRGYLSIKVQAGNENSRKKNLCGGKLHFRLNLLNFFLYYTFLTMLGIAFQ